jgi:hypothetical protein
VIGAGNHLLCETDDAARNRRRFGDERGRIEFHTARSTNDEPRGRRQSRFVEIIRVFPSDRSFAIQNIHDATRKARLEQRQQLVTDAIPWNREIGVRDVLAKRDAVLPKKIADLGSRCLDKRAHNDACARVHAAQTPRTRTSQQTQKKCFGLIVFGVRDGNRRRAEACGSTIEKRITRDMCRVLDRHAGIARQLPNVDALDFNRHVSRGCEVAAELLVFIGVGSAELMIQMRRTRDVKGLGFREFSKGEQHRNRIGSTR